MGTYNYLRGEATIKPELVDVVKQIVEREDYWHMLPLPEHFKRLHAFHLLCLADRHRYVPGAFSNGSKKAPSWDEPIKTHLDGNKLVFGMCFKNYANEQEAFVALLPHLATDWWAEQDWSDASFFIPDHSQPGRYLTRWNSHEEGKGAPAIDFQYVLKEAEREIEEIADVRLKKSCINYEGWTGESALALDDTYLRDPWLLGIAHHYALQVKKKKQEREVNRPTPLLDLLNVMPEAMMGQNVRVVRASDSPTPPASEDFEFKTTPVATWPKPHPHQIEVGKRIRAMFGDSDIGMNPFNRTVMVTEGPADEMQLGKLGLPDHLVSMTEMLSGGIKPGMLYSFSTPHSPSPNIAETFMRSAMGSKSNISLRLTLARLAILAEGTPQPKDAEPHKGESPFEVLLDSFSVNLPKFFLDSYPAGFGKTGTMMRSRPEKDLPWSIDTGALPPPASEDPSCKDKLQGLAWHHQQRAEAKAAAANPKSRPSKPGAKEKRKQQKASRKRNR